MRPRHRALTQKKCARPDTQSMNQYFLALCARHYERNGDTVINTKDKVPASLQFSLGEHNNLFEEKEQGAAIKTMGGCYLKR